jgi:hypothetical protein
MKAPFLIGQLKAIAAPFYIRLSMLYRICRYAHAP